MAKCGGTEVSTHAGKGGKDSTGRDVACTQLLEEQRVEAGIVEEEPAVRALVEGDSGRVARSKAGRLEAAAHAEEAHPATPGGGLVCTSFVPGFAVPTNRVLRCRALASTGEQELTWSTNSAPSLCTC